MIMTSLDAKWHLHAEFSRLLDSLSMFLERQRHRGRTPAADAVRSFVIEEGEAEGLLSELAVTWKSASAQRESRIPPSLTPREEVASLAESSVRQGAYLISAKLFLPRRD